ncbi:MAG: dihydrodipicolinate synthase family protein [Actinomycetota bacterium]|nr:dihydrodipicolinate synthase family protein [Actinomycetota bacterium]
MTQRELRGVFPVFQTPYRPDGGPDLEVLEAEFHWMFGHGIDGLVMGMVSEVLRLNPSEVAAIGTLACAVAHKFDAPCVISVGAESTYVAVENARRATDYGASALMAIPPLATATSDDETFGYYSAILRAVDVPLVVQDASGYVGQPLSIAVQVRLLDLFGDQVMFKPEAQPIGQRISELRDKSGGRAKIFEGTGGLALVDSYRRGIVGTMPGADLCWAVVRLWQALQSGNEADVCAINGPFVTLISMQAELDAFIAIEKHLLQLQGVFPNTAVRGPVSYSIDPETALEVNALFNHLRDTVQSLRVPRTA